jgi:hypothetical protein
MSLIKDRSGILQYKYIRDADEGENDALTFRPLSSISV